MTKLLNDTAKGGGLYIDRNGKTYKFRGRVSGKQVSKALVRPETGAVATVSNTTLTEARRFIADMKGDAATGGSRHFAHINARPKPGDYTVAQAWEAYMKDEGRGRRRKTVEGKQRHWTQVIEPAWGKRAVRSITRRDAMELLLKVRLDYEDNGMKATSTNIVRANLSAFFNWCLTRFEMGVEANPVRDIAKPVKDSFRPPRPLSLDELSSFFKACAKIGEKHPQEVAAIEFLLRSACRRTEVWGASWDAVGQDGLLVTAERSKNGCPILIPMAVSMRTLIGDSGSGLLFGKSPRWIEQVFAKVRDEMGIYFTPHDLRDTFMTRMEEPTRDDDMMMFPMDIRDACLNHRPSGVGAKHYHGSVKEARWLYPQRKVTLAYWNEWLDQLKAEALAVKEAA